MVVKLASIGLRLTPNPFYHDYIMKGGYAMCAKRVSLLVFVLLAFTVLISSPSSAQTIRTPSPGGMSGLPGPIVITPNQFSPQQYDLKLLTPHTPSLSPVTPGSTPRPSRKVIYENQKGEIKIISVPPPPPKESNEKIDAELVDCKKECVKVCMGDLECSSICKKACEE